MTPESIGLRLALTLGALLFAALGATLLDKGARGQKNAPSVEGW